MSVDGEDGFYRALRWKGQSDRAVAQVLSGPIFPFDAFLERFGG